MSEFAPRDPGFEQRVRKSFEKQRLMQTLGVELRRVDPGEVEATFAFREDLTQQHGYLHAGVVSSVLDSACGYAALTLMAPGTAVLAVEFKINFVRPAAGETFAAFGRVVKSGRTLSVCEGKAYSEDGTGRRLIATMQSTVISLDSPKLVD